MRKTATFITASIVAGAAAIGTPGIAEARFGAGAITSAVYGSERGAARAIPAQLSAQHRAEYIHATAIQHRVALSLSWLTRRAGQLRLLLIAGH